MGTSRKRSGAWVVQQDEGDPDRLFVVPLELGILCERPLVAIRVRVTDELGHEDTERGAVIA
ncbi:MAG TPA: hypothetical protein VMZ28_24710 [Kofleriaceae bacterium]|nr:hypothetical protein [Kofleriaceae bacterium]